MSQDWFTAKELAGLSGMPGTHSAVVRRAKRDGWKSRQRRAQGGGREYAFSSLPLETQAAVLKKFGSSAKAATKIKPEKATKTTGREELWDLYEAAPNTMKEAAQHRLVVIESIERLQDNVASKTDRKSVV